MQPDSSSRTSLLSRMAVPAAVFLLLLSFAGNAFFLVTREKTSPETPIILSQASSSVSSLDPVAFGDIVRPIQPHPQIIDASGGLKGVKEYVVQDGLLPAIPQALRLYRDQGVQVDGKFLATLFASMHAPVDPVSMQLSPDTFTFKSADGLLSMTLSLPTRTLIVTRPLVPGTAIPPEKADDAEVLALAKTFAATLGIGLKSPGEPVITETPATSSQPRKTFVVWPLLIDSFPVIDQEGAIVPALKMQIGRVAHRAISASLSLLSPDVLALSQYPTLPRDMLIAKLRSGGLLPMPKSPEGESITYHDAKIVYLLLPQDSSHPTYLLPVMKVAYLSNATWFMTFVPLLDPQHFNWK